MNKNNTSTSTSDERIIDLLQLILNALNVLIALQQPNLPQTRSPRTPTPPSTPETVRILSPFSSSARPQLSSPYHDRTPAAAPNSSTPTQRNRQARDPQPWVPGSDRWYCIFRGLSVGPMQGWLNVIPLITKVSETPSYKRFEDEDAARAAYREALQRPGFIKLLDHGEYCPSI
ncbi:hypothetical protein M378DRAFT_19374 [Amanita muscaria Koide BX008]|uniref:Uncharacterized protein n=1 Tax=Amanita muscaria (strain Koide BX008) TaxID=946122 RepID=A0A0C2SJ37_AMAMK|nr:hypothetical protein M378DRAFT_19374 [Amanita muscaria Koide BX008]